MNPPDERFVAAEQSVDSGVGCRNEKFGALSGWEFLVDIQPHDVPVAAQIVVVDEKAAAVFFLLRAATDKRVGSLVVDVAAVAFEQEAAKRRN